MNLQTNPQLELAYQYICNTKKHLFLTGKAGSGKTTFLHKIREARVKRMAIVAPTGVAAINAGGMTIHSLFQIPIGMHLPGVDRKQPQGRFRAEKTRLIRSLDLLVIDEVSMVRADLLDAIDEVLRRVRSSQQPFGGVQLLMIGDLHQLPPVVKPDEWDLLHRYYETPYFFGSQALRKSDYIAIELKHIYRQSDPEFIALLNQVRDSCLDERALQKLNSRYVPNFYPSADLPYITLTATNAAATEINNASLERLPGKKETFQATITGDFPTSSFPTEEKLELKVGAQVMFIRNDTTEDRLFFNGKLGSVTRINDDHIAVRCPNENQDIIVEPIEWENIKYTLNEQTKAIEEQIVGTFTQYPLRHAWAITIHKSQGLTFDRCIIDAQAAFASGQVYVALSRCKSFEGIVLRTRIVSNSVKTDPVVKEFSAEAEKNIPTEAQLRAAKHECQTSALHSLFQFDEISEFIQKLIIHGQHLSQSLTSETVNSFATLQQKAFADLQDVSKKFSPQLAAYLQSTELPEENEALQARLRKASSYFVDKILLLMKEVDAITIETDNKEVATQFASALSNLKRLFITKKFCFAACSDGFTAERISRAKCDAELEIIEPHLNREMTVKVPKDVPHPKLYERLAAWRFDMAIERDLPEFDIAPNLTLKDLTTTLPKTKRQLTNIRGIGKARLQKYGDALLKLILDYCQEHGIDTDSTPNPSIASAARPDKSQTKKVTLELFRAGKTIEEIATARSLAISTIESHLSHFVEKGELDISLFLDETSFGEIVQYLNVTPDSTTSMSKEHFGDKYSYGQLKLAYAAWSRLAE
jgi:DNA-binding CsgD family transcriptional regulator